MSIKHIDNIIDKVELKNGTQLILRKATVDDANDIVEYLNTVGGESNNLLFGEDEFKLTIDQERAYIENINKDKNSLMLLGVIDNRIAVGLAYAVNAIQTGSQTPTDKYELIFTNGADVTGLTGVAKNEKLEEKISAKNITVNKDVLKDVSLLNTSSKDEAGEGNGDRALAIANLRNVKMNLTNSKDIKNRNDFFANTKVNFDDGINMISSAEGSTINAYYKEIINTLGVSAETASRNVTSQTKILKDLEMQRLSVSGVSLDEEMTNLIQFQHAYSANAKVISTVDELLDVVINGLKR